MSPQEYALEQAGEIAPSKKFKSAAPDLAGYYEQQIASTPEKVAPEVTYATQRVELAQNQLADADAADYVQYLMQDPVLARAVVANSTPLPGLPAKVQNAVRGALGLQLKALDKQELATNKKELIQRQADLSAQGLTAPGTSGYTEGALEDMATLDRARAEGFTEQEISQMEKAAAMPRDVVEQGDLFGNTGIPERSMLQVGQRPDVYGQLADLERQLQVAYAQRNKGPSVRGRTSERISELTEQIRNLRAQTSGQASPAGLGAQTATFGENQEQYQALGLGTLPEQMQKQRDAVKARTDAIDKLKDAENEEQAAAYRQEALDSLVAEIELGRGTKLKPETITQIEKDAGILVDSAARYNYDANQQLDALSARWRSGTRTRMENTTTTKTPEATSADMLIEQLNRAFEKRDRAGNLTGYDASTQSLLQQIVDNFKSVSANPDRRNLVGEWLYRVTTTGAAAPEMEADIKEALAAAEKAKISETQARPSGVGVETAEQLELPERFMPKEIDGQTPIRKSTAFDSAEEFQKYLAGDALQSLRKSMGIDKQTATRMNARIELFRKKAERLTAQLVSLKAREAELERQKTGDVAAALELVNDARTKLNEITERLQAELVDLRADVEKQTTAFEFSAQVVQDIGQRITDNIAKYDAGNQPAVDAAKATEQAKIALVAAGKQPPNKRNFSELRAARQRVIDAIAEQQRIDKTYPASPVAFAAFLNADRKLQLQLQEEERVLEKTAKGLLNAGLALERATTEQNKNPKNRKALAEANRQLADALGLRASVIRESDAGISSTDKALAQVRTELNRVKTNIEKQTASIKTEFEKQLAAVQGAKVASKAERDALAEKDRKKLQAFQDTINRFSSFAGEKISFEKRREWLELVEAGPEFFADLDQNVTDANNAIEEVQIRVAVAEEWLTKFNEALSEDKKQAFQKAIETGNERIAKLEAAKERFEKKRLAMTLAVERAEKATSSDPEISAAITASIDKRLAKLAKTIANKYEVIKQNNNAPAAEKVPAKTTAQRIKDLRAFEVEQAKLRAQRSNMLGISRTTIAAGGEQLTPIKAKKATKEEQLTLDEAIELRELLGAARDKLEQLQNALAVQEAKFAKPLKNATKQAERTGVLKAMRERVAEQEKVVEGLIPKKKGKVSQASRKQSGEPGKLATGSEESKATLGVVKSPILEERTVTPPTVKEAVAVANKIAQKKLASRQTLTPAEVQAMDSTAQFALYAAAQRMRLGLERTVAELKDRMEAAAKAFHPKNQLIEVRQKQAKELEAAPLRETAQTQLKRVESELESARKNEKLLYDEHFAAQEADAEEALETAYSEVAGGDVYALRGTDFVGTDLSEEGVVFRTKTSTGAGLKESTIARIADTATEEWEVIPEIEVVATEADLPQHIQEQAKLDNMTGKIPGLYDTKTKKVYLVAENLNNENDVVLTILHEIAGHFGLREMLGGDYAREMNFIYNGNKGIAEQADAKMSANKRLSRNTAVEEVLAEIAETGPNNSETPALRRIYNAIKRMIAKVFRSKNVSDDYVRQLLISARIYVKRGTGGRGGEVVAEGANFRTADYKSEDALSKLAERAVAQPKTLREKAGSNVALQFEMQAADMRAGVIKALNNAVEDPNTMGSTREFRQAVFSITAADQHGAITQMSLTNGPPTMFKDAKGYYEVRSSMKNDAGAIFDAVQDIPDSYGNTEAKMGLASAYMIAQRALNKGLKKLDLGALGIKTEQELIDAMAVANADPKLKAALENARTKYNAYNRGMIEWLSSPQVAAITQADAKAYLKDEDYVPYYRVRADGVAELVFGGEKTITIGDISHQPYLAELKGGNEKIMPLDKSIMRNTMLLVTKGMNNMAMKNVGYAMQAAGQGLGPVDKMGKPTNLMPVRYGKGPADASVIRWTQEPDPNKPDDKGDRYLRVQTTDTMFGGVPAELIIKSLEGAHLTLPAFLKWGGIAGDLLRAGVTRTPIYLARQLFRDPFAATATSGLDYGPVTAIFKANREFLKIAAGKSETGAKMIEKGLMQSGLFEGDPANMSKMALQLASGKSQGVFDKMFAKADKLALQADAATRALIYENAIKNGLSEVEASHSVRESMNFTKRGLSPTVQYASRMIPFFNAQIQGLSVLFKAATGNMPANDVLKIKRKFFNNAMLLTGFGIAYAMAMDDDDYYKNAKPRDRYTNFFVPLPGVDEPLKLPIPYEFGFFFSAGVALADAIKGEVDTPQQLRALKDMFVGAIPGASSNLMPQIIKPIAEVYANKSFFSGNALVSSRLEKLDPVAQYNTNTTELAKFMAKMVPGLSPIQIEHIVSGYLGQIPLMVVATTNDLFRDGKDEPTRKLSEMPLIGSSFQRKYGGEEADVVYKLANEAMEAKRTFDSYRKTGKIEDAKDYLREHRAEIAVAPMALQYQKLMGALRTQEDLIRNSNASPDAKEKRIDALNAQRQLQSERYLKAIRRAEEASGRTTPP